MARAEREQAEAEARMTAPKFLQLAAAAGNPGLQTWEIVRTVTSTSVERRGFMRKTVETTVESQQVLKEVRGWIVDLVSLDFDAYILSDDGGFHRARWETARPTTRDLDVKHSWRTDRQIPEGAVSWDHKLGPNFDAEKRVDGALRLLCAQFQLDA